MEIVNEDADQQIKELMIEHGVYSEGDVGSESDQDERGNTPSVVSMAVSAKKGRVSMSNAGSVMGMQQT